MEFRYRQPDWRRLHVILGLPNRRSALPAFKIDGGDVLGICPQFKQANRRFYITKERICHILGGSTQMNLQGKESDGLFSTPD